MFNRSTHYLCRSRPIWIAFRIIIILTLTFTGLILKTDTASADIKLIVKVTDCSTGKPIAGAKVKVLTAESKAGGKSKATTDSSGQATIYPLRYGDVVHTVQVSAPGYETAEVSDYMKAWSTKKLQICLNKNQEIPVETQETVPAICGLSTSATVQSGMTGYPLPVFIPCGTDQPILYGSLGQWGDERLYRFYNPQIVPVDAQESSLGIVQSQLISWDNFEEIQSCQECGLPEPNPQKKDSIILLSMHWEPQPRAFEPVTLVLDARGEGSTINGSAYIINIYFGEDKPFNFIHLVFDSENTTSKEYLNPTALQEGDFQIRISNLRFPTTYDGSIYVTIAQKSKPEIISTITDHLAIGSSPNASLECVGFSVASLELIPSPFNTAEPTLKFLYTLARIQQLCGDNTACQAEQVAQFQEEMTTSGLEKLAEKGGGLAEIFIKFKQLLEWGLSTAKCGQYITEFFKALLHKFNKSGNLVNGFMTASPVYPVVENPQGQKVGFLPDGSVIEDIPNSSTIQIGEQRIILIPGSGDFNLSIRGYDSGSMSLYVIQTQQEGGDMTLTYNNIPVTTDDTMMLSTNDNQHTLIITKSGESETRFPDEVLLTSASGETVLLNSSGEIISALPTPIHPTQAIMPIQEIKLNTRTATLPSSGGGTGVVVVLAVAAGALVLISAQAKRKRKVAPLPGLGNPSVYVLSGSLAGQTFPVLGRSFVIGRHSSCDLSIPDVSVSRRHAQIRYAQGSWFMQDLGSKGGTYINGQLASAARLNSGDKLRIGSTTLVFLEGK